jgi:uncharacterized protein YegP (UPF0339 family)
MPTEVSGHIEVYRDHKGDWRWRRVAENGRVLADGGQGYSRRIDLLEVVAKDYPSLEIVEVEAKPQPKQLDDDYEAPAE